MLGLASYLMNGQITDITGYLREAFARYDAVARAEKGQRRFATRSQLMLAQICSQHSLLSEAHAALMRAQNQAGPGRAFHTSPSIEICRRAGTQSKTRAALQESNLTAAVLLERAALTFLHADPPAMRKWAFHLVLAALRFSSCHQPQLADRAYRSAGCTALHHTIAFEAGSQ